LVEHLPIITQEAEMSIEDYNELSVRYHDCDPYRHLNTGNYLRYMVECDLAGYEERGHSLQELTANGKIWRARRCFAEFFTPLYFGDQIRVISRSQSVQDSHLLRNYEIYAAGSEHPAAAGRILWELADLESGEQERIPEEIIRDLFPYAERRILDEDSPIALSTRPQGAYAVRRHPEWRDCGPGYHLSFTAYIDYFVYTTLKAAASRGWTMRRSEEAGLAYVVRKLWIEFPQPVFAWDELELETWLSNIRRFTVLRNYTLRVAGKRDLYAWGQFLYASVSINNGRPIRFPQSIWQEFAPQISPDDLPGED
jgi:YbgC/YbaW family acyl-CoA thioester hydrolase